MTYKIGTRVKKVRGDFSGLTGRVIGYETVDDWGDIRVAMDTPWESRGGFSWGAGEYAVCRSFEWEPILDLHEPCESEFKESLDKLLSEVSCEAV